MNKQWLQSVTTLNHLFLKPIKGCWRSSDTNRERSEADRLSLPAVNMMSTALLFCSSLINELELIHKEAVKSLSGEIWTWTNSVSNLWAELPTLYFFNVCETILGVHPSPMKFWIYRFVTNIHTSLFSLTLKKMVWEYFPLKAKDVSD